MYKKYMSVVRVLYIVFSFLLGFFLYRVVFNDSSYTKKIYAKPNDVKHIFSNKSLNNHNSVYNSVSSSSASKIDNMTSLDMSLAIQKQFRNISSKVSLGVALIRVYSKGNKSLDKPNIMDLFEFFSRPPNFDNFRKDKHMPPNRSRNRSKRRNTESVLTSVGSGMLLHVSKDNKYGFIVTNNHVVQNGDIIKVSFYSDKHKLKSEVEAQLVGKDKKRDIAVLKIKMPTEIQVKVLQLANSEYVRQGDLVFAFGSPIGLIGTVTMGIVSAVNRYTLDLDESRGGNNSSSDSYIGYKDYIQTDATITRGNSGGPLVNIHGEVIGMNTLIKHEYVTYGFAVSSRVLKNVVYELIANKKIDDYNLGIFTSRLDKKLFDLWNISTHVKKHTGNLVRQAVVITAFHEDSNSIAAGLKRGDVIIAYNGKSVPNNADLLAEKNFYKANDYINLTVFRPNISGGRILNIKFKLVKAMDNKVSSKSNRNLNKKLKNNDQDIKTNFLGMVLIPLKKAKSKIPKSLYNIIPISEGMYIDSIISGSSADSVAGVNIEEGCIVESIDYKKINSLKDIKSAIIRKKNSKNKDYFIQAFCPINIGTGYKYNSTMFILSK